MSDPAEHQVSQRDDLPVRTVNINQIIGYNMAFFRQKAGLTQEELGHRLGGWTKVAVSAAERSWDGKRIRKFDADEIVAIATALGVPAMALLLPPADAGTAIEYVFVANSVSLRPLDAEGLVAHLAPVYGNDDSPTMVALRERIMALGASGVLFQVADAVLRRAREEANTILTKARDQAFGLTGDARARAESLERDAQERHRRAVGALVQQREELERRVEDLRNFEREYRRRLLEWVEQQASELRAGSDDTRPASTPRAISASAVKWPYTSSIERR